MLAIAAAPARAEVEQSAASIPEHRVADAEAPVVTEQNLVASERFWPYRAGLVRPWLPVGRSRPLPAGTEGVLIRVEDSGLARIDFGRDGLFEVPVGETDLVERANRVRRGELPKDAPNFVLSIAPRLADPEAFPIRVLPLEKAFGKQLFLSVHVDPRAEQLPAMAKELATLGARDDTLVILFPAEGRPDATVAERLRAIEWPVPFVFAHLAAAYERIQLGHDVALPAVALHSAEGRLLFRGTWRPGIALDLIAVADRESQPTPSQTAGASAQPSPTPR